MVFTKSIDRIKGFPNKLNGFKVIPYVKMVDAYNSNCQLPISLLQSVCKVD